MLCRLDSSIGDASGCYAMWAVTAGLCDCVRAQIRAAEETKLRNHKSKNVFVYPTFQRISLVIPHSKTSVREYFCRTVQSVYCVQQLLAILVIRAPVCIFGV